ncbi:discoidin domain-containing protein [Candidatus Nitrosocosmicus hydrocola]|uniref:discoidin domain-containing protein n=1 Tax=Candidatus Nitrosocosmicus hydrocola TaxID=1826872 RepID=UPI0011E5F88E|nr:discoidin domain-containing protein [Candidatus Nitrosocosmicus hydrocola]
MVKGTKINEITVGGVTVSIWTATDPAASHHDLFTVEIGSEGDDDWVCIGGGVRGSDSPGNFLTASFPSDDFKSWNVASRDHINLDAAPLVGFAIGMKIPSLTKQELISNLKLTKATSDSVPHPKISSFVNDGFLLLGGGFRVLDQLAGNLGTSSYPDSTLSWRAQSKDHDISSPSRITAFAIGIRSTIIKLNGIAVGSVATSFNSLEDNRGLTFQDVSVSPLPNFALSGGGGTAHYQNVIGGGRYLFALEPMLVPTENPTEQLFSTRTSRIEVIDINNLTGYAMGIKFMPSSSLPPSPSNPPGNGTPTCDKLIIATEANSSGSLGTFGPRNVIDGKTDTKWMSITNPNPWIQLTLDNQKSICRVDILWANDTQYKFNISMSTDSVTYTNAYPQPITRTGTSTISSETYHFTARNAVHIRITITDTGSPGNIVEVNEISLFSNQG